MNILNVFAPQWDTADSYGRIASELRQHLTRTGIYVNAMGSADAPGAEAVHPAFGGVLMGYPTNYEKFGTFAFFGPRIALTMYESTRLRDGWVDVLNQCDAVIVPSTFVRDLFVREGVTAPLHVIPLGVGAAYSYRPRRPRQAFTFLCFADRGTRKGWWQSIHAFHRAFGDDPTVRLIVKSREDAFPVRFNNAPNIQIMNKDLSERKLAALYARCDALIAPACGEGFGLLPREFAATGGLALATHWSGTTDHIDQWGIPITAYTLVPAWDKKRDDDQWAECDIDALAAQLRMVRSVPLKARNAWGKTLSENARRLYSWEQFASGVYAVWQDVVREHYANRQSA